MWTIAKMHLRGIICCFVVVLSVEFNGQIQGKKLRSSGSSFIEDKVQLSIMYCEAKRSLAKRRQISNTCLKIWNRKYDRYCKDLPHAGSKACSKLKWKMTLVISRHTSSKIRTNGNREYCQIGLRRKSFNTKYQYCCEGHIKKKKLRNAEICCTKVLIDTTSNTREIQCCNKSKISLKFLRRAGCCHDELYDEEKYMCYGGSLLSKTTNYRDIFASFKKEKNYTRKHSNGYDGANYKQKIQLMSNPVSPNSWKHVLIGCSSVLGCFVVTLIVWFKRRYTCLLHKSSGDTTSIPSCSSDTSDSKLERASDIHNITSDLERLGTDRNFKNNFNTGENNSVEQNSEFRHYEHDRSTNSGKNETNINSSTNEKLHTASQTSPTKAFNLTNSMGKPFCCHHVFTHATRSLQLPNSSVKLTLSEQDSGNGLLECFASSFSCLTDVYSKLQNVITPEETIVSPAVEYMFPLNGTLNEFASVEMEIGRSGKDLHVWKIESDQGKSKVECRHEIPLKEYVNVDDKTLDAYYEIIEPGKIRIYIKHFCWLVCTVCQGEHYGFNLAAYIYMSTMPQNNLSKKVRLTMYILDDVQQLKDYRKCIHEDERNLKMVRNIDLPLRVKLEDNLVFQYRLFEETQVLWVPQEDYPALSDNKKVILHRITKCHKQKSNSQPFAMDMHFVNRDCTIYADTFIFEGVININLDPAFPGTLEEIPENKFTVAHEVDFTDIRKAAHSCMRNTGNYKDVEPTSNIQQYECSPPHPQQQNRGIQSQAAQHKYFRREMRAACDQPLCGRQLQTFVRAENEPDNMTSSIWVSRHVTPSPELSQRKETVAFKALRHSDIQGSEDVQNQTRHGH